MEYYGLKTVGARFFRGSYAEQASAFLITATINDNADRVREIHGSVADHDPSKAHLHLGLRLHPGAERYYREKGWLR